MIRQLENTQVQGIIVDLRNGASVTAAARNAGTSKARLGKIVSLARQAEAKVIEGECTTDELDETERWAIQFYIEMEKAQGNLESTLLDIIIEAAKKDWKAAAWTLERLFPDRFAKRPVDAAKAQPSQSLTLINVGSSDPVADAQAEARKILEAAGMDIAMVELTAGRTAPPIDVEAEIGDLRDGVPRSLSDAVTASEPIEVQEVEEPVADDLYSNATDF